MKYISYTLDMSVSKDTTLILTIFNKLYDYLNNDNINNCDDYIFIKFHD